MPGDDRSGTWVRVGGPAAGANWGALYTPRIGSEVTVQFIEGDIDRPVIVGGLYGRGDAMPFSAGVDSGVNHPGVIAGLHSQRLDGDGFNQFALDLIEDDAAPSHTSNRAGESIGQYLEREGYSNAFRDDYLIPMTAAVWSTSPDKCSLDFPATTLVRFLYVAAALGGPVTIDQAFAIC